VERDWIKWVAVRYMLHFLGLRPQPRNSVSERTFAACVRMPCIHTHIHTTSVCVCLCGARACGCVGVCIGVRAFLGVRFLVFREILAFICYVLKLTSLQSCFCFCCCCAAFAVFAVSLSLSLCLSLSLYLACLCA